MDGLVIALIVFCSVFVLSVVLAVALKLRARFKNKGPKYSPVKDSPAEEPVNKKNDRVQRPVLLTPQNNKQEFETLKEQNKREASAPTHLPSAPRSITPPRPVMHSRTSTAYDDHNYDDPEDERAYNSSFDNRFGRRQPLATSADIADDLRNMSPEMKRLLMGNVLDSKTNKDVNDRI